MKTKIGSIIVSLALVGVAGQLSAQEIPTPSTFPSASSMGLVAAVNHTTGNVNVSVPLFDFKSNGIGIPIALVYNTSGIRVEDRPTEMGLGWRLVAGGKITRVVKRRPDDLALTTQLWGKSNINVARDYYSNSELDPGNKFINYNEIDGEPDLFYYEIPGKSGMFVLDGNNRAHTIPYQSDIKVEIVGGTHFMIKDNSGAQYVFGNSDLSRDVTTTSYNNDNLRVRYDKSPYCRNICGDCMSNPNIYHLCDHLPYGQMCDDCIAEHWEKCYHQCDCDDCDYFRGTTEIQTYVSTWHLNYIDCYNRDRIEFSYTGGIDQTVTSNTYVRTWTNNDPLNNRGYTTDWTAKDKTYSVTTSVDTRLISGINWGYGQSIAFAQNTKNNIAEIIYSVSGSKVKEYEFSYETFANRTFLQQIMEVSTSNSRQRLCSFEYDKRYTLPTFNSYDYDSWGYYNGKGNTTHFPSVPVNTTSLRDFQKSQGPGADKSPVLEYAKAGALTAIVYNTGGKVEYTYGLNKYYSTDIGGLRVEKISYFDENSREVSSTSYEYGNSELGTIPMIGYFSTVDPIYLSNHVYRSGRFNEQEPIIISSKPYNDMYFTSGGHIMYGSIIERFSDGSKIEYTYSQPDIPMYDHTNDNGNDNRYADIWIYLPDNPAPTILQNGAGWNRIITSVPKTSRFWRHGLLSNTKKYDSNGQITEETSYTYKYDQKPPVIIKGYAAFKSTYQFLFEYQWESMPVLLASTSTTYFGNAASTVSTTYTYDNEWAVPVSVSQTDSEGNRVRTAYRYAHSMNATSGPLKTLKDKGILAPVETVTYKNDRVVAAELTEYGSLFLMPSRETIYLPVKKYSMPLQSPVASITQVNLNGASIVYDPRYKLAETYIYDRQGQIVNTTTPEGEISSIMYLSNSESENTDMVIAEVSNALYMPVGSPAGTNQVIHTSFEDWANTRTNRAKTGRTVFTGNSFYVGGSGLAPGDYVLTYWKSTDQGNTWQKFTENISISVSDTNKAIYITNDGWLDEVRLLPVDARIKTFTYTPDGQISSQTDHNGRTTYREYDHFGRLVRVLDNDRQVLESYEYNIKN